MTTILKSTASAIIFSAALAVGFSVQAKGDIVVVPTFDVSNQSPDTTDYEGNSYDGTETFPLPGISIGTFNFTIPTGEGITGATISGTFGDVNLPTTTPTDLFVLNGSIEVGECDIASDGSFPPCAAGTTDGSLVPWSYTFTSTDLTNLAADFSGGSIDFTAVQNFPFGAVVVGDPVLDIQTTPEPASIFTLAAGLLALAAMRRRK